MVGGFIGADHCCNSNVTANCYVQGGSVSGNDYVGGFSSGGQSGSYNNGKGDYNCYAVVSVSGTGPNVHSFYGYDNANSNTSCFYDSDLNTTLTATSATTAVGVPGATMKSCTRSTFVGDYATINTLNHLSNFHSYPIDPFIPVCEAQHLEATYNDGYPILAWENVSPSDDDDDDDGGDGDGDGDGGSKRFYINSWLKSVVTQ